MLQLCYKILIHCFNGIPFPNIKTRWQANYTAERKEKKKTVRYYCVYKNFNNQRLEVKLRSQQLITYCFGDNFTGVPRLLSVAENCT